MIEFHKVEDLVWQSDFFSIEQKREIEREILQHLYDHGIKATSSVLSKDNERALKLKFLTEADEATFMWFKCSVNAENNNW